MKGIFDVSYAIESIPAIAKGIPVSLSIAVIAFSAGILIGLCGALIKIYNIPVLKQITAVYISFMRGTPLLVQIMLSYFGIPIVLRAVNAEFGTAMDISFIPAIYYIYVAFALNAGAYLTETIRAAILSIDRGQLEASYSVGMTTYQSMKRIILPQALKVGLPNIGNHFIAMLKDTSLAFAASVPEIMGLAKIVGGRTSRILEAYIVAALLYWVICIGLERLMALLEKRLRRNERGVQNDRN
ncbi:amino acid ABC transporter permease [Sinanaerobacter chloroacetimidivorans]|jgi:His/Glu/Gln/Arg/opine family amino acid ABC transporter permease subunit|uniref:Amino acid ABC transporter permease n=1 Tax=Sinanaerobacter chloroacetimidivorans TaxID=2818044 RepID=A0A8J7W1K2_9FIRM|nr:amino acid ABC transporter permease [Sinanaerobacter chloroacetimidivorans]MBR0597495.1 amino acid ABC transporter permease [Sinanaerobacter chloroacetimidivorans]